MTFLPGAALIWAAFVFGLTCIHAYVLAMRGDESSINFARRTYLLFSLCIMGTSILLMSKLVNHEFAFSYVYSYSSTDLPIHYLLSTFWAGQEGSFLLWLFWGTLIGFPLYRSAMEQEAPTMIVYMTTLLSLVMILMKQSPFAYLDAPFVPPDGQGLNPLLQDPWMTIHPPVMFIGFASLGVPFSFAIAGLWKRRWDSWIVRSLPWVLVSFLTLGTAILMGGYWAYKTLGWGGYWGWDPVENTSLVPWIAVTALLHGMWVQKVKGRYRRLNFALAILAFVCIMYGTFLTRSGVLADFSVHSFVDLGITGWLAGFLIGFLVLSLALLAWRFREIPSPAVDEPFLSRGVFLLLAIATMVSSGLVILLGTSAPLITRLAPRPSQVALSFYNTTNTPVAFLVLILTGLLPFVPFGGIRAGQLARKALGPAIFAAVVGVIAITLDIRHPVQTPIIVFAAFSFAASMSRYVKTARKGVFQIGAGYLAHAGMAVMMAGIILSSAFDVSKRATLRQGESVEVLGRDLTFRRPVVLSDGKNGMEIRVIRADESEFLAYPKLYQNSKTGQMMANPHVEHFVFHDLYVTPMEYEPGSVESSHVLSKGESASLDDFEVRFDRFQIDREAMVSSGGQATVGVDLVVIDAGQETPLRLQYSLSAKGSDSPPVTIPGRETAAVRVGGLSASEGKVELRFSGDGMARPSHVAVDVTVKPMINLVWGGFYMMMIGGLLALIHRIKMSLAVQELEEPSPGVENEPASTADRKPVTA